VSQHSAMSITAFSLDADDCQAETPTGRESWGKQRAPEMAKFSRSFDECMLSQRH
jgi:hypothetical protein